MTAVGRSPYDGRKNPNRPDERRSFMLNNRHTEIPATECARCSPSSDRSRGSGRDMPGTSQALRRSVVGSSETVSCASPLSAGCGDPADSNATDGFQPAAGHVAGDSVPLLFTPSQAAQLLQVRESWLRRRAARRLVPCTFLGKHLRFSRADLDAIAAGAARSPDRDAGTISRGRARPGAKGRTRRKVDSYDHFGDEHI